MIGSSIVVILLEMEGNTPIAILPRNKVRKLWMEGIDTLVITNRTPVTTSKDTHHLTILPTGMEQGIMSTISKGVLDLQLEGCYKQELSNPRISSKFL